MRAYEIATTDGIDALRLVERPRPQPGFGELLVRVRAVSLNYRDLLTINSPEERGIIYPRIPCSDAAGEIVAVGPGVTRFRPGDSVISSFLQAWESGPITPLAMASNLGGSLDGTLAEEIVLREAGAVLMPPHLSYAEAACLPSAGLTAWTALVDLGHVNAGDTVLVLGTGGVAIAALQFAMLHGARVIITSSSNDKLARAASIGAAHTINYVTNPEWDQEVVRITRGRGVDHVIELGGRGTLQRSIEATRIGGHIALIGGVQTTGAVDPIKIMRKALRVQGIFYGSRTSLEAMARAVTAAELRPVVDARFPFDDARGALHALRSAQHFGKIVVELPAAVS